MNNIKQMDVLAEALYSLGITASSDILEKFSTYMDLVLDWNEKVNLTAIKDRDEFVVKHFIDSLCCVSDQRFKDAGSVVDIGTGAGFPGLPLAIVSPDKHFVLADSLNKRIRIIDDILQALNVTNVTAVHGRAEEMARKKEYREAFDFCVSRAVSRLSVLSEYCLPFIRKEGYLAAYKGPEAEAELAEARSAIFLLGGKADSIEDSGMEKYGLIHRILYIKKVKNTPKTYPRKPGTPEKQPL